MADILRCEPCGLNIANPTIDDVHNGCPDCGGKMVFIPHGSGAQVQAELDNLFTYHAPKGDQHQRYEKIRAAGKELARVIMDCVPDCADRSAAIRKVREACMTANAGIACNEN